MDAPNPTLEHKKALAKKLLIGFRAEPPRIGNRVEGSIDVAKGQVGTNPSLEEVQVQLTRLLSEMLKLPEEQIKPDKSFDAYGLDSMIFIALLRRINSAYDLEVQAESLVEADTMEALALLVYQATQQKSDSMIGEWDTGKEDVIKELDPSPVPRDVSTLEKDQSDEPLTLEDFERIADRQEHTVALFNDFLSEVNYREITRLDASNPEVTIDYPEVGPIKMLNFSNYNYLGYGTHPKVIEAAKSALDQYGLGATASPAAGGKLKIHLELEEALVAFFGKDHCGITLFAAGFNAVSGSIAGYMREGDHVVMDGYAHASIVDGATQSLATLHYYNHNDMEDLELILKEINTGANRILICTEGVFSADGDYGQVADVVGLARKYGAKTLVDEAHSLLLAGSAGRGACEMQGVLDEVDMLVGTFSKTFAGVGGFLLARHELTNYINLFARNRLFSCALDPAVSGGVLASLILAQGSDGDERRVRLMENSRYFCSLLKGRVELTKTETWVVSVLFGREHLMPEITEFLAHKGMIASPLGYPAAPKGRARIRHFISSEHRKEQLDRAAEIVLQTAEKFGFQSPEPPNVRG